MSEEKKYEVLPGVELPDIKAIQAAASDFNNSGVNDIQFKTIKSAYSEDGVASPRASAAELAELQSLGEEVAENEARIAEESRRRMEAIKSSAVKAPESLSDLINYNRDKMSEEAIKAAEEKIQKEEALKKVLEDKEREREERRQLQQRLLEEARERAALLRAAQKSEEKKDKPAVAIKTEEPVKVEEPVKAEEPVKNLRPCSEAPKKVETKPETVNEVAKNPVDEEKMKRNVFSAPETKIQMEPTKNSIVSLDESFDDFSSFFDDSKY